MIPDDILITPIPKFLPEQSDASGRQYVFSYTVTIENRGAVSAQLISRHWIITDGNNSVKEIRGQGVVGEQPVLAPGASYTYTSGCALPTPVGTMQGSYQMLAAGGQRFDASIPEFVLAVPSHLH